MATYVGFLVNGTMAMTFDNKATAYKAFKTGFMGLVGEIIKEGVAEVCYADTNFPTRNRSGCYFFFNGNLDNRLEVIEPDNWIIKAVNRELNNA